MQTELISQSVRIPTNVLCRNEGLVKRSEEQLVAAAQAGSLSAFEELVECYETRVFRVALGIAQSHEDAEEIMQNAFVQAFKNIARFRGDSRFYTWLVRITINEGLMKVRRRRYNEISIDDQTEEGPLVCELEDWGPNPEQRYSQEELRRILATTIAQLHPGYRVVFQLRDVEGFSTQETADALDLSPTAVKSRLRRARLQLRHLLNDYLKPRSWHKEIADHATPNIALLLGGARGTRATLAKPGR